MPPVTRKRKTPEPSNRSEEELSVENDTSTFSQLKYKCPVDGCRKMFKHTSNLRVHHRTHTKVKPYKCTFSSCNKTYAQSPNLIEHIRNIHNLQTTVEAKKYMQVQKEILTEEAKQLGIKEKFTGTVYGEVMSENEDNDNATVKMPTLPHFTTIHQTSTGKFTCPFSECDKQINGLIHLKKHYRIHCGIDYRPFRCIFPVSCQYAAKEKDSVEDHIRRKHIPSDNTDLDASDFVETRTDWLQMEDALFSSAQIVIAPEIQRLRPYKCSFDNCSKFFTSFDILRNHLRTHTQSKPFRCAYPNCDYTANVKQNILTHIYSIHFNVPYKKHKNLSEEEKQRAQQYFQADQDELDNEESQIANARIGPKKKRRKLNNQSTKHVDTDNESPDYSKVKFKDETTEDEDDKDELAALLATVQPTSLN